MRAIRSRKYRKISEEACLYDTLSDVGQIEPIHQLLPTRHTRIYPRSRAQKEGADPQEDRINDLDVS